MAGVSEEPTKPVVSAEAEGKNVADSPPSESTDANRKNDEFNSTQDEAVLETSITAHENQNTLLEIHQEVDEEMVAKAMTLDVAYQSLEMVRKVNVQVEFGKEVADDHCVPCLRAEHSSNVVKTKFGKWISKKAATSCLTCGSPVCSHHRSSDFGKQNITICSECAHLFSMNHLVHHVMQEEDPVEQKKRLNNMLEVYDRALLVLLYSTQYIDDVEAALRGNTSRHNKIGLGSSATGVVAGSLGVAAACTIFTPVGPPLLLASILFGGGATAVNAGSEAVNYRCEPNKMADRILTLHSIISSIANLPDAMDNEEKMEEEKRAVYMTKEKTQKRLHLTRAAMNGLKPLTAGALSAISIVTEARELKNTVDRIRAGNPCDKAERLVGIKDEVDHLPKTEDLSSQLWTIVSKLDTRAANVVDPADTTKTEETQES